MKRRAAFTVLEVMVSLGVMVIGSMAIIGMQQQTTRANVRAREIGTAMQVAQTWIERLKLDGTSWTTVSNSTTDLAQTSFLRGTGAGGVNNGNGTGGAFVRLVPIAGANAIEFSAFGDPNMSNCFDYFGNDVSCPAGDQAAMANVRFCTSYRLTWVFRDAATNMQDRALRADVRVWWPKESPGAFGAVFAGCDDDGVSLSPPPLGGGPPGVEFDNYHVVYLSTVIKPLR